MTPGALVVYGYRFARNSVEMSPTTRSTWEEDDIRTAIVLFYSRIPFPLSTDDRQIVSIEYPDGF